MSHMPAKIVLKSTTTKTLNDRFTEMAKKQVRSPPQVTITGVRSNQFQLSQASMKNRRLATQMANRPDIQAALGGNSPSLKSRLGSPNRGGGRGGGGGGRGRGGGVKRGGLLKNRLGTGITAAAKSPGGFGGRFRRGRGQSNVRGVGGIRRGGSVGGRGGRGMQGASRGAHGGRGANRGRGRGRGKGDKPVSRDKLDAELDQYMSKTKSHLDAELDDYMQHADDE